MAKHPLHLASLGARLTACGMVALLAACSPGEEARALPSDASREARAEARACDAGEALACTNLGTLWMQGLEGLSPDPQRALGLWERACRQGASMACVNAARTWLQRPGDEARARTLFRNLCNAGDLRACHDLAELLVEGIGGDADPDEARELFRRACDARVGPACQAEAELLLLDELPPHPGVDLDAWRLANRTRAVERMERGCMWGAMSACTRVGDFVEDAAMPPATMNDPLDWYQRACQGRDGRGCWMMGELLLRTAEDPRERRRGEALRERACEHGWQPACERLRDEDATP